VGGCVAEGEELERRECVMIRNVQGRTKGVSHSKQSFSVTNLGGVFVHVHYFRALAYIYIYIYQENLNATYKRSEIYL
jgi:hypothetical protein